MNHDGKERSEGHFHTHTHTHTHRADSPSTELVSSGLVTGGYFGNRMLVNGKYNPYLEVKRTW